MPEDFMSDESIHEVSGTGPRMPAGIPTATCLECGEEHRAFYAAQAHECRIELKARDTYINWLRLFQRYGYGILKDPSAAKFPFDKVITGRTALTFQLQSDMWLGPETVLQHDWYSTGDFEGVIKPARTDGPDEVAARNEAWLKRMHDSGFGVGKVDPTVEVAKARYQEAHKDD